MRNLFYVRHKLTKRRYYIGTNKNREFLFIRQNGTVGHYIDDSYTVKVKYLNMNVWEVIYHRRFLKILTDFFKNEKEENKK